MLSALFDMFALEWNATEPMFRRQNRTLIEHFHLLFYYLSRYHSLILHKLSLPWTFLHLEISFDMIWPWTTKFEVIIYIAKELRYKKKKNIVKTTDQTLTKVVVSRIGKHFKKFAWLQFSQQKQVLSFGKKMRPWIFHILILFRSIIGVWPLTGLTIVLF